MSPPDLEALAAVYRHERAQWDASPRAAEVRRRLLAAAGALRAAADAVGDLLPDYRKVAALETEEAYLALDGLHGLAGRLQGGADALEERGATRGGARPLAGLGGRSPRFMAMLRLREALGNPSRRELLDAAAVMFELAGDANPERGLADLARRLPQNLGISAPVVPYADAVA